MITDIQVAELCCGIYDYPGQSPVTWDHYDDGRSDEICWGVKTVGYTDILVFRGSTTLEDWFRDFDAWARPFGHDALGPVHPGFMLGIEQVADEIQKFGAKTLIIGGHSLGAARASILTGILVVRKTPPLSRVVFGEPKPGFSKLADLIKAVPARSYRNKGTLSHDLITDTPFSFPPEEYVHPAPLCDVSVAPAPDDPWGPFRFHHCPLYLEGLKADPRQYRTP